MERLNFNCNNLNKSIENRSKNRDSGRRSDGD
jgi:hypothetical protein